MMMMLPLSFNMSSLPSMVATIGSGGGASALSLSSTLSSITINNEGPARVTALFVE